MSSGGWLGHTVSKVWHGVTGAVKNSVGAISGLLGSSHGFGFAGGFPEGTFPATAAPTPTATEQAEYGAAPTQKKKRGKNSLYVSSSAGSSGGGSGINL